MSPTSRVVPRNTILIGDAFQRLRQLPDECVDTIVTSPPYFNLRDYHVAGQLGQEGHVEEWVAGLRAVARECQRALAPHGSLWLNLGDAYSAGDRFGAPRKSLLLGPERVARALVADGWLLRNKVVWGKSNALPSPARDRLNTTHEYVYLFVRRPSYFFDLDAIRAPLVSGGRRARSGTRTPARELGRLSGSRDGLLRLSREGRIRTPARQEPRRRLADRLELVPRGALRDLPGRTDPAANPGRLSASRLHAVPLAVAAIDRAGQLPGRRGSGAAVRGVRLRGSDPAGAGARSVRGIGDGGRGRAITRARLVADRTQPGVRRAGPLTAGHSKRADQSRGW